MWWHIVFLILFAALYLIDRIVKLFFEKLLLINTDGFYGLIPGSNLFFIIVSAIILPALIIIIFKTKKAISRLGLVFLLAGVVANITDRIVFGGVLDLKITFFNFSNALNLADIYIVAGIIILITSVTGLHD